MTQQKKHNRHQQNNRPSSVYRPNQHEYYFQRKASEISLLEARVVAQEQDLPRLYRWFQDRVNERFHRHWQELQRMQWESQQRQRMAGLSNAFYILGGRGRPQYTGYQEELFLLQADERMRLQDLKEEEMDRSYLNRRVFEVRDSRRELEAQKVWLQQEYQNLLKQASSPEHRQWLQSLPQSYPVLQGQPSSSYVIP